MLQQQSLKCENKAEKKPEINLKYSFQVKFSDLIYPIGVETKQANRVVAGTASKDQQQNFFIFSFLR